MIAGNSETPYDIRFVGSAGHRLRQQRRDVDLEALHQPRRHHARRQSPTLGIPVRPRAAADLDPAAGRGGRASPINDTWYRAARALPAVTEARLDCESPAMIPGTETPWYRNPILRTGTLRRTVQSAAWSSDQTVASADCPKLHIGFWLTVDVPQGIKANERGHNARVTVAECHAPK